MTYDEILEFVKKQNQEFYCSGSRSDSLVFVDEFSTDTVIISVEISAIRWHLKEPAFRAWLSDLDEHCFNAELTPSQFLSLRENLAMGLDPERESVQQLIRLSKGWIRPALKFNETVPFETIFNIVEQNSRRFKAWKNTGFHVLATTIRTDFASENAAISLNVQHPAVGLEQTERCIVATLQTKEGGKMEAELNPEQWSKTFLTLMKNCKFFDFEGWKDLERIERESTGK